MTENQFFEASLYNATTSFATATLKVVLAAALHIPILPDNITTMNVGIVFNKYLPTIMTHESNVQKTDEPNSTNNQPLFYYLLTILLTIKTHPTLLHHLAPTHGAPLTLRPLLR